MSMRCEQFQNAIFEIISGSDGSPDGLSQEEIIEIVKGNALMAKVVKEASENGFQIESTQSLNAEGKEEQLMKVTLAEMGIVNITRSDENLLVSLHDLHGEAIHKTLEADTDSYCESYVDAVTHKIDEIERVELLSFDYTYQQILSCYKLGLLISDSVDHIKDSCLAEID